MTTVDMPTPRWEDIADMPPGPHRDALAARLWPERMRREQSIYPLIDTLIAAEHERRAMTVRHGDTAIAQRTRRRELALDDAHHRAQRALARHQNRTAA